MAEFNSPSFQMYYQQIDRLTRHELDQRDPAYLLTVGFEEYLRYLVDFLRWEPLEWDESGISVEPINVRVQDVDRYYGQTVMRDQQMFRLRIPVSPHRQRDDYLKFRPSEMYSTGEPEWKFTGDTLVIDVPATQEAVNRMLDQVRFYFGGRNKEIERGNSTLEGHIRPIWEARRRQLEERQQTVAAELQKLNIPLFRDPNARAKPVEMKPRTLRIEMPKAPTPRARLHQEPYVRREDVLALVSFVEQYARQFEVAPETYAPMSEEQLRNLIVGMVNTNYPGKTTAETFSKLGKTDIRFQVDEGNVLIFECKFWSGEKSHAAALAQLFRYLTWRENFGVLLTFCARRDMTAAVAAAKNVIGGDTTFVAGGLQQESESRFATRHRHPQDAGKAVEIFHVFIDLSV